MGLDRSEYSRFMRDVRLLEGEESWSDFQKLCKQYAQNQLGSISQDQFKAVFDYAWEEGHASGYEEIASIFDDILDIVEKFVGNSGG